MRNVITGVLVLASLVMPFDRAVQNLVQGKISSYLDPGFDPSLFSTRSVYWPPKPQIRLPLTFSVWHTGPYEIAKVFGRSTGCRSVNVDFIDDVNEAAIRAGVDPGLYASTVATESNCNPLAVSKAGAIGLSQVVPSFHKEYDFSRINLFNRKDSLRVGAEILAKDISQYGEESGVTHYQGMGVHCSTCDDHYTDKVLALADHK
jgi:hypothetical protein